jgi:hypothetical protein
MSAIKLDALDVLVKALNEADRGWPGADVVTVIRYLYDAGWQLTRNPEQAKLVLPAAAKIAMADARDEDSLRRGMAAAGPAGVGFPSREGTSERWRSVFMRTNVRRLSDGTCVLTARCVAPEPSGAHDVLRGAPGWLDGVRWKQIGENGLHCGEPGGRFFSDGTPASQRYL